MKKIFSVILALALVLTLAACGGKPVETQPETTVPEETVVDDKISATLEEILNGIYEKNPIEIATGNVPLDLNNDSEEGTWAIKSYTGLDSAEDITEGMASEAMIGSIPYSLVLVRVAEGADAQAVAGAMKSGIDQRKWICVEADDLMVAGKGDVVMLVMIGSEYGTAQSFVDAFTAVVGEPDFTLQ